MALAVTELASSSLLVQATGNSSTSSHDIALGSLSSAASTSRTMSVSSENEIIYRPYVGEADLPSIMALVQSELSEPYVIYTYRYFLQQWPHLSFLAYAGMAESAGPIGVIVCKQSMHRDTSNRGYIAMLSVNKSWRKRGIARTLVQQAVTVMKENGVEQVVLETEYDNAAALALYESLGFIREKRLYRFYMNGKDAFRLVLSVPAPRTSSSSFSSSINTGGISLDMQGRHGHGHGLADLRKAPLILQTGRSAMYNTRVIPEFIAGFDDSDSDDDEVSRR